MGCCGQSCVCCRKWVRKHPLFFCCFSKGIRCPFFFVHNFKIQLQVVVNLQLEVEVDSNSNSIPNPIRFQIQIQFVYNSKLNQNPKLNQKLNPKHPKPNSKCTNPTCKMHKIATKSCKIGSFVQ